MQFNGQFYFDYDQITGILKGEFTNPYLLGWILETAKPTLSHTGKIDGNYSTTFKERNSSETYILNIIIQDQKKDQYLLKWIDPHTNAVDYIGFASFKGNKLFGMYYSLF